MSQQINLFNPIFLKQKKYFSALAMAQALGLILFGSALVVAYANLQVSGLSKEIVMTGDQLAQAQAQLLKINAQYAQQPQSKSLEYEIQKNEADVRALQQVFDILKKGEFGNMVALRGNDIVSISIQEAVSKLKTVDPAFYDMAKTFFG